MKNGTFKVNFNSTNVRYNKIKQDITRLFLTALNRTAPDPTRRLILNTFFSPAKPKLTELETAYLKKATEFKIKVHQKEIQCWRWGSGPGILFVHGWNGRGIQFCNFFQEPLNSGYSVITYDAPAHGASAGRTTNYFEMSDTVRAFLDPVHRLGIKTIIAHSLGASATINCMHKTPMSFDAVLIAPALKLKEILYNTFNRYGIPAEIYLDLISDFEKQYGYNLEKDNPYELLHKMTDPLFLVHDKMDHTVPYTDSKRLSKEMDHVYLHTTKGLGHKRILKDHTIIDLILQHIFTCNDRFEKNLGIRAAQNAWLT